MKEQVMYRREELRNLLSGFRELTWSVKCESEDYVDKKIQHYFVTRTDIVSVSEYLGTFYDSTCVKYENGEEICLYSDNLSSSDRPIMHRTSYTFFSPSFETNDEYIIPNKELNKWLNNMGITQEHLDAISNKFTVYETIEYTGVSTPVQRNGYFGYSSEDLVLDEREITSVLDGIEDVLLREKIKCILHARVFKRRY